MTPLLAHLMGTSPHVEDILLYGGASLGLACGIGLFLWGRHERHGEMRKAEQVPESDQSDRNLPLFKSR